MRTVVWGEQNSHPCYNKFRRSATIVRVKLNDKWLGQEPIRNNRHSQSIDSSAVITTSTPLTVGDNIMPWLRYAKKDTFAQPQCLDRKREKAFGKETHPLYHTEKQNTGGPGTTSIGSIEQIQCLEATDVPSWCGAVHCQASDCFQTRRANEPARSRCSVIEI
jgi:hypothetical protein